MQVCTDPDIFECETILSIPMEKNMRVTPIDSDKKKKRFEIKTVLIIFPLITILSVLLFSDLLLIRSRRKIVNEQIRIYANYQIADQLNKHLFFGTIGER